MQGNEGIETLVLAEEVIAPRCLHVPLVSHAVTPCSILTYQFQNEVGILCNQVYWKQQNMIAQTWNGSREPTWISNKHETSIGDG